MDRIIKKSNKGNLKNSVILNLEREYEPLTMNSETQEVNYEESNQEENNGNNNIEIDNINELEQDISEINPTKRRKGANQLEVISMSRIKNRVNTSEKLSSGLTPYEIMYGKQDDDFDYIDKSLN